MRTSAPKHLFVILLILGIGQWWTEYGKCYLICTQQRNKSKTFLLKFNPPRQTFTITTTRLALLLVMLTVLEAIMFPFCFSVVLFLQRCSGSRMKSKPPFSKRPQRFTLQLSCSFLLLLLFCFSRGHIRFPLPSSTTSLIGQRTACPQVRNMMSHGLITS